MEKIEPVLHSLPLTWLATSVCTRNLSRGLATYFNIAPYTGDDKAHVNACQRGLAHCLGIPRRNLAVPRQSHSLNVALITGDVIPPLDDIDALVTNRRKIALCINTADCIPLVFSDGLKMVIGAAHAGWRGVYGNIVAATIDAMRSVGTDSNNLRVAIGPCIAGESYEVDLDLASKFEERFCNSDWAEFISARPELSWVTKPVEGRPGKKLLNLPAVAAMQLKACGVREKNIVSPFADSFRNPDYFSYRRDISRFAGVSEKIGRTATVIMMR